MTVQVSSTSLFTHRIFRKSTLIYHTSKACDAAAGTIDSIFFFPNPSGRYHVGKTQHVFNHTTHDDPVAPDGSNHTGNFIVVTILYPTTQAPNPETSLKYMDHTLADLIEKGWGIPEGELQKLWTPLQWQPPVLPGLPGENKLPTLLFSPGAGMPCSSSTMITANMASQGYTVLCIDHPGEPPYLKLPYDGGGQYGIPINYDWANYDFLYKINKNRKSDYDALLKLYPALVDQFGAPFNKSTYIHFGFSMGGSIGTDLVSSHESVMGGINYDGAFIDYIFGETVDVGKPFLMLRDDQNRSEDSMHWVEFQGNQTGWWEHLLVKGSHHLDFSDVSMWFDLLSLEGRVNATLTGTIKGRRMHDIMIAFTTAFFDKVLGKMDGLTYSLSIEVRKIEPNSIPDLVPTTVGSRVSTALSSRKSQVVDAVDRLNVRGVIPVINVYKFISLSLKKPIFGQQHYRYEPLRAAPHHIEFLPTLSIPISATPHTLPILCLLVRITLFIIVRMVRAARIEKQTTPHREYEDVLDCLGIGPAKATNHSVGQHGQWHPPQSLGQFFGMYFPRAVEEDCIAN
ncbi:uncharacterized protein BDR25DRAFT_390521 [Lindgomyces ingoldianus]|uniref:Uncharacterized protein n=1 Tax=Lindgomyces ingoldianus TaxID=673940 RepID=A0ACB6RGD6_9PLEO|nr:uncharacterized protein BDR25DRAFT_390521 [Lindgomyces ingoldianus]KAF2478276.1 hypothetical protein BDR25DRAFT_390521 [Lindgomyces ingoldianus]